MDQNPEGQGQQSVVGNNQPNPTPAAPSGAIFSGNPASASAAPVGTPNQPTSGRSRPFFSHHPAHTFSREMGDIVVGGTVQPQKKRKTGLIIGIILSVAVLATVATVVIVNIATSRGAVVQAFYDYQSYLNTPPITLEQTPVDQTWSIFALPESSFSIATKAEYVANLRTAYEIFANQYAKVSAEESPKLTEKLSQYQELLEASLNYTTRDVLENSLLDIYAQEGEEGAQEYINTLTPDDPGMGLADTVAANIATYLSIELRLLTIYQVSGCLTGSAVDYVCTAELGGVNQAYDEAISEQNRCGEALDNLATTLENAFLKETANIQALIEEVI